ncbi:hypothetical protein AOX56_05540 [Aeromonas sobria]|uniref:Uncharacterized protein n=1 Tax=Aeromonas sobria TaxID=646 RepID=A0A2N3IRM3_AERSO|nr:hypothetical protein AOX56_05540 [Aeromonas sobria]
MPWRLDLPLTSKTKVIFTALIHVPVIKTEVTLGGGGSGLFAAYPITGSWGIDLRGKAAIGRVKAGFATLGANRTRLISGSAHGVIRDFV